MTARRDPRFWALLALFLLTLGLQLATPRLDSDQAVTGLMGMHVLRGEFPIFFWKQDHAGVPESYGAAVTFFLFGVSRWSLSLVPALAALGLVLVLYRTAALLFGHGAGLLAILFATVVSPYVAAHYVLARAYYIEQLLAAHVVLLGAALGLSRPLSEAGRTRALVAMGLAGGVGFYFGFQIVDALVPAALALLLVDPGLPRRTAGWLGVGAFLLGSAPFWVYNLTHDWATFATGARFQGRHSTGEALQLLFGELLPVVLGVRAYIGTPPYLPWPLALAVPAIVAAAFLWLLARVAVHWRRVRRDPALAGEALLVAAAAVTLGVVWSGRFLQVPRYLVPLAPVLALVLARACQLLAKRTRAGAVAMAAVYVALVGFPLAADLTVLWPASRDAYRAARAEDLALFAFLQDRGLDRAYSFEYWLAPRLTFDARERIVVAEPFGSRYPPHTEAVDASPRPAYVIRGGVEWFEGWMQAVGTRATRAAIGSYDVFWGFVPPPPVTPLPRAGWTVRTGHGRGEAAGILDGWLDSGWASAPGPPGSAWVEIDLGEPHRVAGLTLVADQPTRQPQTLELMVDDGRQADRPIGALEIGGLVMTWRNGAPRVAPGVVLSLQFPAVEARRLRLTDRGPGGTWAVAELFLMGPAAGPRPVPEAVGAGQRIEARGEVAPALQLYRDAMRAAPSDPAGYAEFTRLAGELGLQRGPLAERAARYARLGLVEDARRAYARVGAALGPGVTHAELAQQQARLATTLGEATEAARQEAEARAALTPRQPLHAVFGRLVELAGFEAPMPHVRPGERLELTYHWRLVADTRTPLTASVRFRSEQARFADDHGLPAPLAGLPGDSQHILERRQVIVPSDAPPGRYRIVAGVWDPGANRLLRRWWRGLLPTWHRTVEVGAIEVLPAR